MRHDMSADPTTSCRVSKWHPIVKTQFQQPGQTLQQQGEVKLHFTHCLLGIQALQALPGQALTVEPERRPGQTGFKINEQIGILPICVTLRVGLEFVSR